MTEHTPEPWFEDDGTIFSDTDGVIAAGDPIAYVEFEYDRECTAEEAEEMRKLWVEQKANLERIVACVNACAGIPTEQLGDVKALVEALEICATPIRLGDQNGLDFEGLAREVNRRQTVAFQALAPFRKD